mgnify:FL=1
MPFIEQSNALEVWARRARRVLVNGPPNSGKSTSLRTWPTPMVIISAPGEKGTTSLPQGEGIRSFVWDAPDPNAAVNWVGVLAEVNKLTFESLSGKYGPIKTFALDGLHKLYDTCLQVATNGAKARGEDFEPKKYGPASALCFGYLEKVMLSAVENVVFTCWDGLEKDDPDEKGSQAPRHLFPELPGKAAKLIMGEFAVVLYSNREGAGPAAKYIWQTQPLGRVWGAGVKMPLEVSKRLPLTVPQDWGALERLLIPA